MEPFLTDVEKWSDGRYLYQGSFDKDKMDLVRKYLLDNEAVVNPNWDLNYMREVFNVWELFYKQ